MVVSQDDWYDGEDQESWWMTPSLTFRMIRLEKLFPVLTVVLKYTRKPSSVLTVEIMLLTV